MLENETMKTLSNYRSETWTDKERKHFDTAIQCVIFVEWLKKNHPVVYSRMLDEMQMDR